MMFSTLLASPLAFLISAATIIAAITIHEFSHALAADRLGDPTPRLQGRLTLNPLAHLDPLGTILLLIARFGWGKPVMFDPFNLANPRRDAMVIGLAGPVSNLITATLAALILGLIPGNQLLSIIIQTFIAISVSLAIFNLVPIHPLDGGKILTGLLPRDLAMEWEEVQSRWGTLLLLFFLIPWTGGIAPIFYLIGPVINVLLKLLLSATGNFV